jgi:hypothetical protein
LDLRRDLRREARSSPVVDRPEGDAVVVDFDQGVAKGEDLEAARIGQDRPIPAGEGVQPAQIRDQLVTGPEMQVIRVAEDDLRADGAKLVRVEALHRPLRADGHEGGRADLSVRRA